jgi:hypothetical protein
MAAFQSSSRYRSPLFYLKEIKNYERKRIQILRYAGLERQDY